MDKRGSVTPIAVSTLQHFQMSSSGCQQLVAGSKWLHQHRKMRSGYLWQEVRNKELFECACKGI